MVRYRVGARFTYVFFSIILMGVGIAVPVAFIVNLGKDGLIGLLFLIFFIAGCVIFSIEMYFRYRRIKAMRGEVTTGRIVDIEVHSAGRGIAYSLIIVYPTKWGQNARAIIPISGFDKDEYTKNSEIEVYVNGKYGYIKKY